MNEPLDEDDPNYAVEVIREYYTVYVPKRDPPRRNLPLQTTLRDIGTLLAKLDAAVERLAQLRDDISACADCWRATAGSYHAGREVINMDAEVRMLRECAIDVDLIVAVDAVGAP